MGNVIRSQRCALLASSNFTSQLLEFGLNSKSRRDQIVVLNILNWKTAAHYGTPQGNSLLIDNHQSTQLLTCLTHGILLIPQQMTHK